MKKILVIALVAVLAFGLVACGKKPATTDGVKTGIGVVFSNYNSADPKDGENGKVDTQTYVAAVMVDKDGKILNCAFDALQSTFEFTADSEILTAPETTFKTKNERGDDYGMKKASSIGKEWFEQAAAFAQYCVGKTVSEVKNMAVTEGKPADTDLASSMTLSVAPFQGAVVKAVESAQDLGAKAGDKLGLGISGSGKQSVVKAEGDKPASALAYNFYAATTFGADGKVTSCIINASQAKFEIKDGVIATDINAPIKTKNELGDEYGMKKASSIGKEWYEQAAAFANYTVGKTLSEIKGIKLTDGAPAKDSDLASSCTVTVTDMIEVVEKASLTAK
ncbi:MAG TPA: hypothetical protein GX720_02340 [Clostridiaceae bacterium]|nr:hypothetical protein [Clostridiaceae bacterium]